jgi:hypothetical protein
MKMLKKYSTGLIIIAVIVSSMAWLGFTNLPSAHREAYRDAVIKFDTLVHDFGTIKEGDIVSCDFKFTNTGDENLYIRYVEQACGCMATQFSKKPIKPGQSSVINVKFNSKDRPGPFRKTMVIRTNIPRSKNDPLMLMIKGNVIPKKRH